MARPKLLHEQVSRIHSFERDRYKEFEELCRTQKISVSEALRELIERELQKNAVGVSENPIGVDYIHQYVFNAKKSSQSDLTQWIETVHQNKDNQVMLTRIENISKSCAATARSYINQNRRYRHG